MDKEIKDIAEEGSQITINELLKALLEETESAMKEPELLLSTIRELTDILINHVEFYSHYQLMSIATSFLQLLKQLELERDLIYDYFFELLNKINLFLRLKIIVTYVHIDETGRRELRLYDNNIDNIHAVIVHPLGVGVTYTKLQYIMDKNYKLLKNALPEEDNEGLQQAASEVTARYNTYKRRILWYVNNLWCGYRLQNRGPINEAFGAFFIHKIPFDEPGLEENINQFMLHTLYGVIAADNANGFLIGDTSLDKLQFAIKGKFGAPQNYFKVLLALKALRDTNFSKAGFDTFVKTLVDDEKAKATSLITPLTKNSISHMVAYHKDSLLKPLTQFAKK